MSKTQVSKTHVSKTQVSKNRMNEINTVVSYVRNHMANAGKTPVEGHIKTADIRKTAAAAFAPLNGKPKGFVFAVCEALLEQHYWPMRTIAFDFAHRMRKHYDEAMFPVFERWLERYVDDWGGCDDLCVHAFGELICQYPVLSGKTIPWTQRAGFWMRRAAAVVLIPSIRRRTYEHTNPLQTADLLMHDQHDLVRKGYGWMLKELSVKEPELVFNYLLRHKETMPRVAFRYAMEKMSVEKRRILMDRPGHKPQPQAPTQTEPAS